MSNFLNKLFTEDPISIVKGFNDLVDDLQGRYISAIIESVTLTASAGTAVRTGYLYIGDWLIQIGTHTTSAAKNTITFDIGFSVAPKVFATLNLTANAFIVGVDGVTTTTFDISVVTTAGVYSAQATVWIAIGKRK